MISYDWAMLFDDVWRADKLTVITRSHKQCLYHNDDLICGGR